MRRSQLTRGVAALSRLEASPRLVLRILSGQAEGLDAEDTAEQVAIGKGAGQPDKAKGIGQGARKEGVAAWP